MPSNLLDCIYKKKEKKKVGKRPGLLVPLLFPQSLNKYST